MASSSAVKALSFLAVVLLLSQAVVLPVVCRQLSENSHSEKVDSKSSTETKASVQTSNSSYFFLTGFVHAATLS
jgi:hypothetical protein